MISATLLLLALSQSPMPDSMLDRPVRTREVLRAGGRSGVSQPFFSFAPSSGAGMGTACACAAVTGTRGEALTFTRASVAECYSNDGQTLTQCGNNLPRVSSGTAASSWLGLWVEPAATNLILQSRDLSQAAWTKTNMTCTLTATGMRGAANSASSCTATLANATVCQTITTAAASRNSSWHLRKGTITGAVTLARDGATYGADISASLSSSAWRRAVPTDTPGCAGGNCIIQAALTGSVLNPQVCLKLANSGDSILIDFVQDESGDFATTPILTTAASATRQFDAASVAHAAVAVHSMSGVIQIASGTPTTVPFADANGATTTTRMLIQNSGDSPYGACQAVVSGSATSGLINWFLPIAASTGIPLACTFGASTLDGYVRAATFQAPIAGNEPAATSTAFLGSDFGSNAIMSGTLKGFRIDGSPSGGLWTGASTGTAAVAWVGDSITQGLASAAARPPQVLGKAIGKYVQNFGNPGQTSSWCLSQWRTQVRGMGYTTLILLCGVNDLAADASAAAIYANLSTIYSEALADGLKVIAVNMTPWANSAQWTAGRQTVTDSLKALIAGTGGVTVVNTDSLGTGSPLALTAPNDSGDHIHPSVAGSTALAALVQAANP